MLIYVPSSEFPKISSIVVASSNPGGTFRNGDYIPPGFEDAVPIDQLFNQS